MEAESYFHLVTIAISWDFYNKFFDIIVEYGVIYIPFVVYLYNRWIAKLGDDSFNNMATLSIKGMTVDMITYLLLYAFAILPTVEINTNQFSFTNPNTNQTYTNEQSIKMPILWYSLDYTASIFTGILKQALPSNIQEIRKKVDALKKINIKDSNLKIKISYFIKDCYTPALAKYQSMDIQGVATKDIDWFGSSYFLKTEGFYKACTANSTSQACGRIEPNGNVINGDVVFPEGIKANISGQAKSCRGIWLGADNLVYANAQGLRTKIAKDMKIDVNPGFFMPAVRGYALDERIRDVLFVSEAKLVGLTTNADNKEDKDLGPIDSIMYAFKSFGSWQQSASLAWDLEWASDFIKSYAPVTQALLLALIVIITPVVLIIGAVSLESVIALFLFYFTIRFLTVIWAVVAWLDDKLLYAVYGSSGNSAYETFISAASSFSTSGNIISISTMTLYILAPIIWFKVMAMVGGSVMSSAAGAGGGLSKEGTEKTSMPGGDSGAQKLITNKGGKIASKAGKIGGGVAKKVGGKLKNGW